MSARKSSAFVPIGASAPVGADLRIFLDKDDAPNPADRETAERVITAIMTNDVISQGSFVIEGYSAARRIAQALTAARADERRRGFDTPYRMREIVPAKGAPAVTARWPHLRPLYHWTTIEGVHFQSYKVGRSHPHLLISDDTRIILKAAGDGWNISLDGQEIIGGTFQRCFSDAPDAVLHALRRRMQKEKY